MDPIDLELLKYLQENARITVSELSKLLSLSRPSIAERLIRLQEKGIIEEFTTRLNLDKIGRDTQLLIHISALKVAPSVIEEMLSKDEDVLECHRVTGQIDYFIKAAVHGMDGMRQLIDRLMPYGVINTSVVLSSPIAYKHVKPVDLT